MKMKRGLICSNCHDVVNVTCAGKCIKCGEFDPLAIMFEQVLKQKVASPKKGKSKVRKC